MSKDLSIERALAPHVDPVWAEALLLELRLRGVAGDVIGDVLAEVDAHVADSGQDAAEAFGDPAEYARMLDLPRSPAQSRRATLVAVLPVLVQVLGMTVTIAASHALAGGGRLSVSAGALVSAVAFAAVIGVLVIASEAAMRVLLRSWVVTVGLVTAVTLVVVLPMTLPVLTAATLPALPALPALLAGIVLLVAGTVLAVRAALAEDDAVRSPVPGAAGPVRPARASLVRPHLRVPLVTLLLVLVVLVFS